MTLNEQQRQEFEKIARPMVKWINDNCHPHTTITVTPTGAALEEGVCAFVTLAFIKD